MFLEKYLPRGGPIVTEIDNTYGKFMPRMIMCAKRLAGIKLLKSDIADITGSDLNIMFVISETPDGIPVSEISEQLGCTVPAVSKRLKPLEQGRFITRKKDGTDHRTIKVYLTEKGRDICGHCKNDSAEMIRRITEKMGDDMDKFIALFEKFIDIAEQELGAGQSESK